MTNKDIFNDAFPQDKQIGGSHYKDFPIQPYEFISKNELSFFQGNVIKYVCRYMNKNGIQDKKIMPKCFSCNEELVWQNDYDGEDCGTDEFLIVSMYQCPNEDCNAWYEVYHGKPEKEKH